MPEVTRRMGVLVTIHASVIVLDVAGLENADSHRDRACRPPPIPRGEKENHRGREQGFHAEVLQALYCGFHQED